MTWDDLKQLRAQGLKPSMPVIVALRFDAVPQMLAEEGCGVIVQKPGEPFPAELLDGLRVWLFTGCDKASNVVKAMVSKGVRPAEFCAWCECFNRMDSQPVHCEVAKQWH